MVSLAQDKCFFLMGNFHFQFSGQRLGILKKKKKKNIFEDKAATAQARAIKILRVEKLKFTGVLKLR